MFNTKAASRRFAKLRREQEILLWRYATASNIAEKSSVGLAIFQSKLKQSLMGSFYGAVLNIKAGKDNEWDSADKRLLKNKIIDAKSLSPAQAVMRTRMMQICMNKWEEAKKKNDFSVVAADLQTLVDSVREEARYKAEQMGLESPYEALLQSKTPGFSIKMFEKCAEEIEAFSRNATRSLPPTTMRRPQTWRIHKTDQRDIQNEQLRKLGYDFKRGMVRDAAHPLCLGSHDDVRIGMRYNHDDFSETVLAVAHEGGHGLYRQGLPNDFKDRLVGQIAGVGMDEAMALIIENHVGRQKGYAKFVVDYVRRNMIELDSPTLTTETLHRRLNRISAEPIRVDADEVRYPLDVILRYKIEKALIDDGMAVADIPAYWAQEFENLTGMKTANDNEGALQDIHWFGGEFGWFPNYLIGQLAAAQLFEKACDDNPGIQPALDKGNARPLVDWLRDNIYTQGAVMNTFDLIEKVTGKPLNADAYKKHIEERYLKPLHVPAVHPQGPNPR